MTGILSKPKPPGTVPGISSTVGPHSTPDAAHGGQAPTTLKAWALLQLAFGQQLPTDARRAVAAASLYAQAVTSKKRKAKRGR